MKVVQGNIVLVPFPFSNLKSVKMRPALVISKNNLRRDVILLAITSQKRAQTLEIDNEDLNKGLLPIKSYIAYQKVVTLEKSLLKKVVAKLDKEKLAMVKQAFLNQF